MSYIMLLYNVILKPHDRNTPTDTPRISMRRTACFSRRFAGFQPSSPHVPLRKSPTNAFRIKVALKRHDILLLFADH